MSASDIYLTLAELPTYTSVCFESSNELIITSSIADNVKKVKKNFSKTVLLSDPLRSGTFGYQDTDSNKVISMSVDKHRKAILKQIDDKDAPGGKRRFVEVWRGEQLEASKDVTDDHGEFYADNFYRSLSFSPSEDSLIYTAEAKEPTASPSDPFVAFRYLPNLGEGFSGKKSPKLFIFRWKSGSAPTLSPISFTEEFPLPLLFGQAFFATDEHIIASGYEQTPEGRLLGIDYCHNRPAGIYLFRATGDEQHYTATRLTPPERSCRSPRITPDLKYIYYLSNPIFGPHASCASLHEYSLESKTSRTIVEPVHSPNTDHIDGFPGLYVDQLPLQPFVSFSDNEGLCIVTHSTWRSKEAIVLISTNDGRVMGLTVPDRSNWKVLAIDGLKNVVCSKCSINEPHQLVLGSFDSSLAFNWKVIDEPDLPDSVKGKLASLHISTVRVPGCGLTETTIVRPTSKAEPLNGLPCISMIHGGPHSTSTQSFSPSIISQALAGYTISLPNYTGSLGFGQDFVQNLIGNCGTLDVEDCMESVQHLINLGIAEEGPGKQYLSGGSHGGFILGHLIGQYPGFFTAAVLRNPVISAGETLGTDIPDWYFSEFGYSFGPTALVTPKIYKEVHAMSPIHYVDRVTTPVLLLMGKEDYRVSPTQAIGYYHALKGRSKAVDILSFKKDGHPLDSVEAARVSYEAARDWFIRYQ